MSVNGLSFADVEGNMSLATFTVDVDRDVNLPVPGRIVASSMTSEAPDRPRFASAGRGLELLVELLDELEIRGTFFLEARTAIEISKEIDIAELLEGHEVGCHGYDHEDLTGEETGVPLPRDDVFFILERARETLTEVMGRVPNGFRAPYLHVSDDTLDSVMEVGFEYDSSLTRDTSQGDARPWRLRNGLMEVPLTTSHDLKGNRIYSYLWPMHEGKRGPDDYIRLMRENRGFLVLATHSWHLAETFSRGRLEEEAVKQGLARVRAVLERGREEGVEFVAIEDYLRRME
jgi:peptidoglycan/xylan/chitin deacetylase (PgdA/CDA1 family)